MTTLLWIHGLGESSRCFAEITRHPALAGATSLTPDLPGYGDAAWPPAAPSLATLADDLADWLAERGVRPIVVGHSMGGVIGLLLAERHPQAIAGLVNVEGNVSPGDCTYSGRIVATDVTGFRAGGRAALLAYVEERGRVDRAHRGYAASLALADPACLHRHAAELVARSARQDLAARQAALAIPSIYIAGAPGGTCARSIALLEASAVRTVTLVPSGHWPFVDQADAFAAAVAALRLELA